MTKWHVVSPEYGTKMPILDDGSGPIEHGCDVVEVEADTKRAAIVAGVRVMRADTRFCHYHSDHCDGNPFTGMKAYPVYPLAEELLPGE